MDLMANPTITDFQQDVNGDIKMLKLGTNKEDAYANIIGQAEGADLENNKAATINVSTYTEPVEVTPTAGKDGMKKATITLSNIPSPSGTLIFPGYKLKDGDSYINTNTSHTGILILYSGSGMVDPFTFTYDSEEDEITISGGTSYDGTYERNTTQDLYAHT